MSLRIPPIAQFLACASLGWSLSMILPQWYILGSFWVYFGYSFIAAGVVLLLLAILAFVRARTTVNPIALEQAGTLVTTGLYRFTRNPMYLAMALILFGGALALGNIAALAAPVVFVSTITVLQIRPEERALLSIFGEAFSDYCVRTRRWI